MKKNILWICLWVISILLTWYITMINVKPEKVIVTQEKIIYKLKTDLQIQKIKEEEQYIIRIPFTDIGITKQFTLGFFSGALTISVLQVKKQLRGWARNVFSAYTHINIPSQTSQNYVYIYLTYVNIFLYLCKHKQYNVYISKEVNENGKYKKGQR